MILEGALSVKAAMLAGRRQVSRLYIDSKKHDPDARFMIAKAGERGIPVERKSREEIDAMAAGRTHGGVIAEAGERQYQSLAECLSREHPFIALVEGVEDPYNLGYVMRALYCAGCDGILLRKRSWARDEGTILRSSAGASDYLAAVESEDPADLVRQCREHGLRCYAAMRADARPYFEADFTEGFLIAIGGEMRGLSKEVLAACSENLYIPYARPFHGALNAAGATAAFAFEAMRQRMKLTENGGVR